MAENVNITIRAFDKTKKGFGSATKGLKAVAGSVFSLRTALIGVAGAAGFGLLVRSSLNATDSLAKTAAKIGTTTEALGALRYAADLTGVATQTMDMALQRFTRRTAEAAKGTGEAKGAIKELGLNAKELVRLPLDQRMIVLADAFEGVNNESDRLRLAFKLFDSEGAALVNTLSQGSDALKEMLGEAKLLGLTMSSTAAKGVEDAVDSLTKLRSLAKGVKDQFVAALAPAIQAVTEKITKFFQEIAKDEGGVEKWAQSLARGFLQSIANIISALDMGLEAISGFVNKANNIFDSFEIKSQENKIVRFKKQIAELAGEISALEAGGMPSIADVLLGEGLDDKKDKIEELMYQVILADEKLKEMQEPLVKNGLGEFFDDTIKQILDLRDAIGGQDGKGNIFGPTEEGLSNVQQAFKDWRTTVKDTDEIVQSFTTNALNGLTDALTAGITGAANFADAIKSMAKSVVDSLIKMLIQKYIVDAAFGFITGKIDGGGGNLSAGGGVKSLTVSGGRGALAIGGPVQAGSPYMVGERGPEMFVPNQSGSIIPNNQVGGGSGVVVNQTINVTTGIQSTVRAEIASLMPQIAQAAKGAVADARVRGGNFSRAMVGA